jgi:uncharacterized repeat protein (TIGR01451 family)
MRDTTKTESDLTSTVARKGTWLRLLVALCSLAALAALAALAVGAAPAFSQQAPSITGFSPTTGSPGTVVTINGAGFTPSSTVAFGGTAAASVTYVSATDLTATVPADAPPGPITVTNTTTPTGTATSAGSYAAWQADLSTTMQPTSGITIPGGEPVFTATITNDGPDDAVSVIVTDGISFLWSARLTSVSASAPSGASCTTAGVDGPATCTTGSLPPGGVMTIKLRLRVTGFIHGWVVGSHATATSSVYDPNPGNNAASGGLAID